MLIRRFQISGQAVLIGAFQTGADCGTAIALALKGGVASSIMQIPDRLFWQMFFDQVRNFKPAQNRETQLLNKGNDVPCRIEQAVACLAGATPQGDRLNSLSTKYGAFAMFVAQEQMKCSHQPPRPQLGVGYNIAPTRFILERARQCLGDVQIIGWLQ